MPAVTTQNDQKISRSEPRSNHLPDVVRALAHDLRTPLSSMQSCLNLVLNGEAGPLTTDQKRFLGMARGNIDRLDRMVEGMLTSDRSPSESVRVRRRQVDLGSILTEALRLHKVTAMNGGLEIDDAGMPESFPARVDPDLVVRLLDNVLGNALKFTGPGGLVRVGLEAKAGRPGDLAGRLARHCDLPVASFTLVVQDNGPGLDQEVQGRIFEPINRGRLRPWNAPTGTGLGLSITRRLAASHGGRVRMVSLPGRGTTVRIKLPRDPASEHFQFTVERLAAALARDPKNGVGPLIGLLDLRACAGRASSFRCDVEGFFGREPSGFAQAWEAAPGLWTAAVLDPVSWSRRWILYASRMGGGLETARWEYLAPGSGEDLTAIGPSGKQPETMVNYGPDRTNKCCGSISRPSSDATED